MEVTGAEQRNQGVAAFWTDEHHHSVRRALGEPLESGCWSGALGCRSPCPCSHLRGTGVGRTAYFFPVGQQWWAGQHKGGICPQCQHACNREGKGDTRDVWSDRGKPEVAFLLIRVQRALWEKERCQKRLGKEYGIREPDWESEKERVTHMHLESHSCCAFPMSL